MMPRCMKSLISSPWKHKRRAYQDCKKPWSCRGFHRFQLIFRRLRSICEGRDKGVFPSLDATSRHCNVSLFVAKELLYHTAFRRASSHQTWYVRYNTRLWLCPHAESNLRTLVYYSPLQHLTSEIKMPAPLLRMNAATLLRRCFARTHRKPVFGEVGVPS